MNPQVKPNPAESVLGAEMKDSEKATVAKLDAQERGFAVSKDEVPVIEQGSIDWRLLVRRFVESTSFTVMMAVTTIYALFGDDIRLLAFRKPADDVFYGLSSAALFLFALEIGLSVYAFGRSYLHSFYFWLDVVATLSLIPDIGWIWEPMVGANNDSTNTGALRAGRASRAGTRAGRIVRIVRLVRLIRIAKVFKMLSKKRGGAGAMSDTASVRTGHAHEEIEEPSQVGKKLSDLTTRRVILIVLAMVMLLPIFDGSLDTNSNELQTEGLELLHRFPQDLNVSADVFKESVQQYVRGTDSPLYISICSSGCKNVWSDATIKEWVTDTRFDDGDGNFVETSNPDSDWDASDLRSLDDIDDDWRTAERTLVEVTACYTDDHALNSSASAVCYSKAYFDLRSQTTFDALMSIFKTLFVMIVLSVGAILFTRDAESLVIRPIERMVSTVEAMAKNPLMQFESGDDRASAASEQYETSLLEATLRKIASLLQVGLGAAGSEIIAKNISDGGELQPLIKGRKVYAVFGFCDIRCFTDTTECLQEDVMVFVNIIGEIVHSAVHQFGGAANKNIGDAFLLVWKLPSELPPDGLGVGKDLSGIEFNSKCSSFYEALPAPPLVRMADNALASFLKVIVDIHHANEHGSLAPYATRPEIKGRFEDTFSVKMGYGLHVGWAIEGAIGSSFKIDASYLSPHVNLSSRLEAATKQYATPLLMSGSFFALLSEHARRRCRRLDRVTVKGSKAPMELYTFDVCNFPMAFAQPPMKRLLFHVDPKVQALQADVPDDFFVAFEQAVSHYLDGDWGKAKAALDQALALRPHDGPSETLQSVMSETDYVAPESWPGYRVLTEK